MFSPAAFAGIGSRKGADKMSIWERLAIAGDRSAGATLGPRFAAEMPHNSPVKSDGKADALPLG